MASRDYRSSSVYSLEAAVKQVFAKVTFGASGAPSIDVKNSKGVASITRVSAGLYDVTFGTPASTQAATTDKYFKLLVMKHMLQSTSAPAAPGVYIAANNIASTGTLRLQFNAAGTATDPASGEIAYLQFVFSDSNT